MYENSSCPQAAKLSQVESSWVKLPFDVIPRSPLSFWALLPAAAFLFQPGPRSGVATVHQKRHGRKLAAWKVVGFHDLDDLGLYCDTNTILILYLYISILCHTEVSIIANQELEELRSEAVNWQLYFTLWHCIQHDPWWLFYVSVWELNLACFSPFRLAAMVRASPVHVLQLDSSQMSAHVEATVCHSHLDIIIWVSSGYLMPSSN